MVKSGSYTVKQPSLFGRIGTGIGQGLSDQLPKEMERGRLAQGLSSFEQEAGNLTPLQQLARLSSIPGISPQMIHTFGELARSQSYANALKEKSAGSKKEQVNPNPFLKPSPELPQSEEKPPSVTTPDATKATQEGYIPPTFEQLQQRAGQLIEQNPGLYANNPQQALQDAITEANQLNARNQAFQQKRANQLNVQDRITNDLANQAKALNVEIPANVYSEIEDKAIEAVKPIEDGGKGLTEQEAKKIYGKELDEISRDYRSMDTIGGWALLSKKPSENKSNLRGLRAKFKKRNDLENFADNLISRNGLSPGKAYYLAYPVSEHKEVNNAIDKLPSLKEEVVYQGGQPMRGMGSEERRQKTLEISPKIAELLKKEDASPLAVAEELKARNYDPNIWIDYLRNNKDKLNLSVRQARELDKPISSVPTLDDLWMFMFSGLDKLVEQ